MALSIGRGPRASGGGDVVDLLLECHGRIRRFAALARTLAAAADPADAEVRDSAARVRRYFAEALPLHVEDEEKTVAPRLRGRSAELDAALETMSGEHLEHRAPLVRMLDLCAALEAEPHRHRELRGDLGEVAAALEGQLAAHLEREERDVFAALRSELDDGERRAMADELRARRR